MAEIREQVDLSDHCRFRVGGSADYFTIVTSEAELLEALAFARERQIRHFLYAGGTNLFFDDAGYRGLVIRLQDGGWKLDEGRMCVVASAGYDLGVLVRELAERGLGGLEFLANIPGSVGGAIVGNAGCYGREVGDVLLEAKLLDTAASQVRTVRPAFFGFGYRHSRLKHDALHVVLEVALQLMTRPREQILAEINQELEERLTKHPQEAWCAGSFFKNPSRDYPAWRAITDAGMAHARIGDAAISPLHANFLVNEGRANSAQITSLAQIIQKAAREKLGIELVTEVRYVGPAGIVELTPDTELPA